jgi:DNA-binding CsgD family transcriptional regulator
MAESIIMLWYKGYDNNKIAKKLKCSLEVVNQTIRDYFSYMD